MPQAIADDFGEIIYAESPSGLKDRFFKVADFSEISAGHFQSR
jgi:hypothetical protein